MRNNQKIPIGEEGANAIDCPGSDTRGYLERKGERLYLKPTQIEPIYYRGEGVKKKFSYLDLRLGSIAQTEEIGISSLLSILQNS